MPQRPIPDASSPGDRPIDAILNRHVRMSHWRWLLFALLEHFEVNEESYFHIPSAKAVRVEVPLRPLGHREKDPQ